MIHCERTKDDWLTSVQDEFRIGKLSTDTHAFLHGEPTLVFGSTILGESMCRNRWCKERALALSGNEFLPKDKRRKLALETYEKECAACRKERQERI